MRVPSRPSLVLAVAGALLAFLLVSARASTRDALRAEEPRKAELIRLIGERRALVEGLDEAVHGLREEVEAAAVRSSSTGVPGADVAQLALLAGTTALRGAGLTVALADSDREPPSPEEAGAYRIHDRDLQLVVNALFAAGAEAVAVNDNRVVATTPIRSAGGTIVVNFRPLTPPYRIVAIGADRSAFDDSEIAARFRRWSAQFGLGFTVAVAREVRVPAYTGRVSITSAQPGPAAGAAAGGG